jgi:hypothetical protein
MHRECPLQTAYFLPKMNTPPQIYQTKNKKQKTKNKKQKKLYLRIWKFENIREKE